MEKKFEHELVESFGDGECIFEEGATDRDLYVVQEGVVQIIKSTPQGRVQIAEFKKGDFFGEMSLLQSLPRYAGAFAKGEVKLLILKPAGFLLKIRRDPTFAFEMLQQMSLRVKLTNERLFEVMNRFQLPLDQVQEVVHQFGGKI